MINDNDREGQPPVARDELPDRKSEPQRQGAGCARVLVNLVLIFIAAGILIAGVATVGVARQGQRFFNNVVSLFAIPTPGPTPTPKIDIGPIVLDQVQGLSELATTQFSMQTVVTASKSRNVGPFQFDTRMLYVAYGEVRAGVDLSLLGPADVMVQENRAVTVTLPPPQILDSKIDVNRSYVYDYQQGVLSPQAPELQTEAERQALDQIIAGACQSSILDQANERAELAIMKLLGVMDFGTIVVNTRLPDPAVDPCADVSEDVSPGIPTPATTEPTG